MNNFCWCCVLGGGLESLSEDWKSGYRVRQKDPDDGKNENWHAEQERPK
jgi:hypothetical protein